jgi:hypothetical protein
MRAEPGNHDDPERRDAPCSPALPDRHHAQPAWGFHDSTGRFSYQLHRVYGPPGDLDRRGPICHLDHDLSYWGVTWPTRVGTADERPGGRWMTYAEARKLRGLTFEEFCALPMREQLAELLRVGDIPQMPVSPAEGAPLPSGLHGLVPAPAL